VKQSLLVSDSGPLIVFAIASLLPILKNLRGPLVVPSAVLNECLLRPAKPGVREIQDALAQGCLIEMQPDASIAALDSAANLGNLGEGEIAVLSACKALGYIAIIDEVRARRLAKFMKITHVGSGGLLLELKRTGLITSIRPTLDLWAQHDYFISPSIRQSLLEIAQEQ
jgi:uncharacterized protein